MDVNSQIHWLRENFIHPIGFLQIGIIGITYLIAKVIAIKIRQRLEITSKGPSGQQRGPPWF